MWSNTQSEMSFEKEIKQSVVTRKVGSAIIHMYVVCRSDCTEGTVDNSKTIFPLLKNLFLAFEPVDAHLSSPTSSLPFFPLPSPNPSLSL